LDHEINVRAVGKSREKPVITDKRDVIDREIARRDETRGLARFLSTNPEFSNDFDFISKDSRQRAIVQLINIATSAARNR